MFSFECRSCGEIHEELPDLAFQLPAAIFELDQGEREERCSISSDLCTLDDEHFFVRCVLEIPIVGMNERFAYGVWSTLSRESFDSYSATFDDEIQSGIGPFFGYLANAIPGYEGSLYLHVDVQPRDHGNRPSLTLHRQDHPLCRTQENGMTEEEVVSLVETVLHPPDVE